MVLNLPPFMMRLSPSKTDKRKTAALVDTNTTPTLSGQNQKKPPKGLVCFADQVSFLAFQFDKANLLATSNLWAESLGQALRGSA